MRRYPRLWGSVAGLILRNGDNRRTCAFGDRGEQLLLPVNQSGSIEARNSKSVPMRDCVSWACLDAVAGEDTPTVVNVLHGCVTLAAADPQFVCVLSGFNVNAHRRARRRAK